MAITVTAAADIVADTLSTNVDTPITANVITGTNDASADSFEDAGRTLTSVTQGTNGSVTFTAAGAVTYTPNANFNGTDTFTYTVSSGGVTETATVTVNVTAAAAALVVTATTEPLPPPAPTPPDSPTITTGSLAAPVITVGGDSSLTVSGGTGSQPSVDPALLIAPVDLVGDGLNVSPAPAQPTPASAVLSGATDLNALAAPAAGPDAGVGLPASGASSSVGQTETLESTQQGFPVVRVETASSGVQLDSTAVQGDHRLFIFEGVREARGEQSFQIPPDAFAHTDPSAQVKLEARTTTGEPLPSSLIFDSVTGLFSGSIPGNVPLEVLVIARDSESREASVVFTLELGVPASGAGATAFSTPATDTGATGSGQTSTGTGVSTTGLSQDAPIAGSQNVVTSSPSSTSSASSTLDVNALPASAVGQNDAGLATATRDAASGGVTSTLESSSQGFPVVRVSLADSGAQLDSNAAQTEHRLFVNQGVNDAKAGDNFQVPVEAFAHTDPSATVKLEARTASGESLPSWLQFDEVKGTFTGTPPDGQPTLIDVVVSARDNQNREASVVFALEMGSPTLGLGTPSVIAPAPTATGLESAQGSPSAPLAPTTPASATNAASSATNTQSGSPGSVGSPVSNADIQQLGAGQAGLDNQQQGSGLSASSGTDNSTGEQGFQLMRVGEGAGGATDTDLPGQGGHRLFTFQGLQDAKVGTEFQIASDVFAHTDSKAVVKLEATTATGEPLPSWLSFDPEKGTFRGTPPDGAVTVLEVVVIARDGQAREASIGFSLQMGVPSTSSDAVVTPPGASGVTPTVPQGVDTGTGTAPSTPGATPSLPQGADVGAGATNTTSPFTVEPIGGAVTSSTPDIRSDAGDGTRVLQGPGPQDSVLGAEVAKQIAAANAEALGSGAQGFQVLRISEVEASRVSASEDSQQSGHRLFVHGGLKEASGDREFVVPQDLFAHTDANAVVRLEARMADGSSLPAWLSFDAQTGTFRGVAPDGRAILDLLITAHDDSDREASLSITLELGKGADGERAFGEQGADLEPQEGGADSDDFASRRVAADEDTADSVDATGGGSQGSEQDKQPAKRSALPFSEQIKLAKATRDPVLAKILGEGDKSGNQRPA